MLLGIIDLMIDSVRASGGIVNQVMGDGVMAIFGAPVADEHHALNACIAAARIHEAIARFVEETKATLGTDILTRVGIHSDDVVVGERGEGFDFQYAAFGEAPHVAARLEKMARPGSSWITANTNALVKGQVRVEPKGCVAVRGLSRTIEVFELLGVRMARQKRWSSLGNTPLIGRSDEQTILRGCFHKASSGIGQVVTLTGEPGVGKSRLVAESLSEAAQDGWLVLESGAAQHLRQSNYFAVRSALQAYFVSESDDDVALRRRAIAQRLQNHLPPARVEAALFGLLGISTPIWEATPRAARQQEIVDALVWLSLTESQRQPVVWAIEDLQWADAGTEAFLAGLVSTISDARIVVLLNHRPEYSPTFATSNNCTTLTVNRLADQASQQLLDEILGSHPSLEPLKKTLAEHTGGNPFFIEECVRTLLEGETLSGTFGQYLWTGETKRFMPTNVQDVLSARIDRLTPEGKFLLQSAAVIGHKVDPLVLQRLTRWSDSTFFHRITELCNAGFLVRTLNFSGSGYEFVHALSHDVAYRSLLQETRRELHAKVVEILEALFGERVSEQADILANHAIAGQQWAKAAHYYRTASRNALSQFACEIAVAHGREALKALDHLPDEVGRKQAAHDIRLELRNALFPLARHTEMLVYLTEAEEYAIALDDLPRQARTAAHLCHCYWLSGDWPNAVAAGRRALAMAEPVGDVAIIVWARFFKALAHYSSGELGDAISLLRTNVATLDGDRRVSRFGGFSLPFVVGADWLGCCLSEQGEFGLALEYAEAGLHVAESAGYPFDLVHGLLGVGSVHLMRGTIGEAIPFLEQALSHCDSARVVSVRPRVLALLAWSRGLSGQIPEALELGKRANSEAGRHGALRLLCLRWFSEVLLIAGRATEALENAQSILEAARKSGQRGLTAWTLRLAGQAQANQGNFAAAQALLFESLDLAQMLGMRPLAAHCHRTLAEVGRKLGHHDEAEREAERSEALYRALGMKLLPDRVIERA